MPSICIHSPTGRLALFPAGWSSSLSSFFTDASRPSEKSRCFCGWALWAPCSGSSGAACATSTPNLLSIFRRVHSRSRGCGSGLGAAMVNTIYSYWGYYNICHLGGEIREPEKNIPRGIFLSIFGITVLYLAMQTSILGVVPWREAENSPFLASLFIEKLYGPGAARLVTLAVLWIALASVFSVLLGYSRVPYSAALDGNFLPVFSKVHPTKHFPHISLLFLGGLSFLFSLTLKLKTAIAAILAMRLLVQFIGQAVAVILLHKHWPPERLPFKMWFYPFPAVLTMLAWAWLFWHTGPIRKWGLLEIGLGVLAFLIWTREMRQWPFAHENIRREPL